MSNARRIVGVIGAAVALSAPGSLRVRAEVAPDEPPALAFSTNLGTSGYASTEGVASDAQGNLYVTGTAQSPVFGGSPKINVIGTLGGDFDVYVMKINAAGTAIEFVTFIGGTGTDQAHAVALDPDGDIYVAASTTSVALPVLGGLSRPYAGGTDAYVAKLSPDGERLVYATYLGGSNDDAPTRIAADAHGRASVLVNSDSADFPVSVGRGPSGDGNAVAVASLADDGSRLRFSRVLAETGVGARPDVATDAEGDVYVALPGAVMRLDSDGVATATTNRELVFESVTVAANGDVYTAALDDSFEPGGIFVNRWTHDLEPTDFESRIALKYNYEVVLAGIAVDSDANVYLADFENGSTENYYSPLRRIDSKGRFTFESVVADQLVGLALSPSRRVGVAANAYFTAPTFDALVPDRGTFLSGFVAQYEFPTKLGPLPTVDRVERKPKRANPNKARIVVSCSGFQPGALVFVGDAKTPDLGWKVKSTTKLTRASDYSADGGAVEITILNLDGGEVQATYVP